MFLSIVFLISGFVFLIKGADLMVDGSAGIAKRIRIPEIIIGLTLVSLGTSAPELIVNIFASIKGNSGLTMGNVLGSNIANTLLVLGVSGIIAPLIVKKATIKYELPFCILVTVILGVIYSAHGLNVFDGLVLISLLIIFIIYIVKFETENIESENNNANQKISALIVKLSVGLIGLGVGGKLVVDNAVNIASYLGMSETLIGLTIVAIGTSLPELFASAVAAYKGNTDIAIGNVLGSNILNIVLILGVSSFINTIAYNPELIMDLLFAGIALLLMLLYFILKRTKTFGKYISLFFVLSYLFYMIWIIIRG